MKKKINSVTEKVKNKGKQEEEVGVESRIGKLDGMPLLYKHEVIWSI